MTADFREIADALAGRDWYAVALEEDAIHAGLDAPSSGNPYRAQLRAACASFDALIANDPVDPVWQAEKARMRAERDAVWQGAE